MLARLHLVDVRVSAGQLLGKPGFGLTHVAATGLDSGRHNLAWGCVGLARACLDASPDYSRSRRQFGQPLSAFELVQRMISRMMTDVHAARLMCWRAAILRARRDPAAVKENTMAKYYASTMVNRVAYDAVQIHGANGCGQDSPIERYFRDARIMEIGRRQLASPRGGHRALRLPGATVIRRSFDLSGSATAACWRFSTACGSTPST